MRQPIPKLDFHVHAVPERDLPRKNGTNYPLPEELRHMYDQIGVDRAVLMPQGSAPEGTCDRLSQREAARMAADNPDVFIAWFCNVDPRQGGNSAETDFSHYLNYYKRKGARGVGEITANLYLDDPRMMNLFAHCEKCRMPVLLHFGRLGNDYGVVDDLHLPRLEKVLKAFPRLIVIGHSPMFWAELGGDVTDAARAVNPSGPVAPGGAVPRLMAQYPNLYVEFSSISGGNAILRDPAFTFGFFARYADRVLYGTDFHEPHNLKTYDTYDRVRHFLEQAVDTGSLTEENYRKICRDNALRLLAFAAQ